MQRLPSTRGDVDARLTLTRTSLAPNPALSPTTACAIPNAPHAAEPCTPHADVSMCNESIHASPSAFATPRSQPRPSPIPKAHSNQNGLVVQCTTPTLHVRRPALSPAQSPSSPSYSPRNPQASDGVSLRPTKPKQAIGSWRQFHFLRSSLVSYPSSSAPMTRTPSPYTDHGKNQVPNSKGMRGEKSEAALHYLYVHIPSRVTGLWRRLHRERKHRHGCVRDAIYEPSPEDWAVGTGHSCCAVRHAVSHMCPHFLPGGFCSCLSGLRGIRVSSDMLDGRSRHTKNQDQCGTEIGV
jgi:hypothetical protein